MSTNNSVNVPLSGSTGTGTFVGSTAPTTSNVTVDNLNLSGNTISSVNTDGDIVCAPNGGGRVVFGESINTAPAAIFSLQVAESSKIAQLELGTFNNTDVRGTILNLLRSRSTTPGTPVIVQAGDVLGNIQFLGDNGQPTNTFRDGVSLTATAAGTPSATGIPTNFVITNTNAAGSNRTALTIDSGQNTLITGNCSANNFLSGYTTTATAAGTTTLTVTSTYQQYFTGSTTQTVVMPVTSTLVLGQAYYIVNNSSGAVTVQSSGANTIQVMAAGSTMLITCILTSGTSAASWNTDYQVIASGVTSITGTANQVIASAATGAVTLSLPQDIATTSAVTFGSVAFSPTTQGIVGTTAGTAASAGYVGEVISSTILGASSVNLPNATLVNLTSITLTAGDWDVWGSTGFNATAVTGFVGSSGSSATSLTKPDFAFQLVINDSSVLTNLGDGGAIPYQRFNVSASTVIYLVVSAQFSAGSCRGFGSIFARRAR